jgi:hypothetical protein
LTTCLRRVLISFYAHDTPSGLLGRHPAAMPFSAVSTNSKKRKSTGSLESTAAAKTLKKPRRSLDTTPSKPVKTIDSFFSPQVPARPTKEETKCSQSFVSLSAEQTRVLRMVVDEGKNVFFTGSAGQTCLSCWLTTNTQCSWNQVQGSPCCYVRLLPLFVGSTRNNRSLSL